MACKYIFYPGHTIFDDAKICKIEDDKETPMIYFKKSEDVTKGEFVQFVNDIEITIERKNGI